VQRTRLISALQFLIGSLISRADNLVVIRHSGNVDWRCWHANLSIASLIRPLCALQIDRDNQKQEPIEGAKDNADYCILTHCDRFCINNFNIFSVTRPCRFSAIVEINVAQYSIAEIPWSHNDVISSTIRILEHNLRGL
ncbi:hypothetical protein PENTCL1PPCAC_542, partial [Pristionchus entomophagus]